MPTKVKNPLWDTTIDWKDSAQNGKKNPGEMAKT